MMSSRPVIGVLLLLVARVDASYPPPALDALEPPRVDELPRAPASPWRPAPPPRAPHVAARAALARVRARAPAVHHALVASLALFALWQVPGARRPLHLHATCSRANLLARPWSLALAHVSHCLLYTSPSPRDS